MLNKFIEFITDDPVMLLLCVIIIFLIVVGILIFIFGRNKKDDDKKTDGELNNTASLLKSDLDNEKLKSTQSFATISEDKEIDTKKVPVIDDKGDITEANAPINIDEAMTLKSEREKSEPPKEEAPAIKTESATKASINAMWNKANSPKEAPKETPKEEAPVTPRDPLNLVDDFKLNTSEPEEKPSIFDRLVPKKDDKKEALDEVKEEPTSTPTPIEPKKEESKVKPLTEQFSSVALNGMELPKDNVDELSKTQIIRHIEPAKVEEPKVEEKTEVFGVDDLSEPTRTVKPVENKVSDSTLLEPTMPDLDDVFKLDNSASTKPDIPSEPAIDDSSDDDIELPKLSSDEDTTDSALSNLNGETFNIK